MIESNVLSDLKINLIECGFTWQGEGPDTGKRMLLLRYKKCNRSCPWCDTKIKMKTSLDSEFNFQQIQDVINEQRVGLMITGGEPTFNENLDSTIQLINKIEAPIYNIETNGYDLETLIKKTFKKNNLNFIYSPKIFNLNDLDEAKTKIEKFKNEKNVYVKLVCDEENDNVEIFMDYITNIDTIKNRVFLMPKGVSREELLKNSSYVFDMADKYQFHFSSRDHIIYSFI